MYYRTPGIFLKEPDNPGNEDDEDADESSTGGNRQVRMMWIRLYGVIVRVVQQQ